MMNRLLVAFVVVLSFSVGKYRNPPIMLKGTVAEVLLLSGQHGAKIINTLLIHKMLLQTKRTKLNVWASFSSVDPFLPLPSVATHVSE